ncbi:MAG: zinc-binding dehydrogenase [Candidatus Sericytochromatia bacterium]
MKAIIIEEIGKISLVDTEEPVLDENEVLVKIKSAALNHRDLWIKKGMYAGIKPNIILGSDGSGIVEKVNSINNESWLGKEVIINPSINWGDNPKVQSSKYKILGLPENGTLAEYIKVDSSLLIEKPSYLNFEAASALPLAALTAYRALFTRGQIEKKDKVLITGIGGGVALFAFQFALAIGAEVFVTSGNDIKLEKAIKMGASKGVNYKKENWEKDFLEEKIKFDLIIDSACGNDFNKLIDLAEAGGRIVFFGGTTGNINKLSPQKVFWKQLSILGSTMGNSEEFFKMVNFVSENKIIPVVDAVYHYTEFESAFERMNNTEQFGKIILNF